MAKTAVLRDHTNAEPLVEAWAAADANAPFSEVLLSTFPPRTWLSSEASRKELESRLSKVSLDSRHSNQTTWRHVCKQLEDVATYGKRAGWDADAEPYAGPLPTYEDIEAIRIIGSKPTGFGMLPNPIRNRINDAHVEFLLEDPSDRKTPIHPFWARRVAEDYPATEKTTEEGGQETRDKTTPEFAHLSDAEAVSKSVTTTDDDLDGHDEHFEDDDGLLGDAHGSLAVPQRYNTRSSAKKTRESNQQDEAEEEEESPRSPISSSADDIAGTYPGDEPRGNEEEEDNDDDDDRDDEYSRSDDSIPQTEYTAVSVARRVIESQAFIGLLSDALRDTVQPGVRTSDVEQAVDSRALRHEIGEALVRAATIRARKQIAGGEGADAGGRGRNKKRRRTSSSVGAQRRG